MSNVMEITILVVSIMFFTIACIAVDESDEQIKQLKQSNIEIQQECEVYRNRCLELENIIEGCRLVVDNCECR